MTRIIAIIQARMSSTRLPGKVMKMLAGKTFLEHCIDRVAQINGLHDVVCATVDTPDCDAIVDLCRKRGYRYFRGSEMNAVNRYRLAAEDARADAIMRVTSDCPLADPEVGDWVMAKFREGGHDLVTTNIPPSWPIGLDNEIFTMEALQQADREASIRFDREHVSTFIRSRPIRYKLFNIPCPLEGRAHWRLTLDTEDDKKLFETLAQNIGKPIETIRWREIVSFLDAHPEMLGVNTPI